MKIFLFITFIIFACNLVLFIWNKVHPRYTKFFQLFHCLWTLLSVSAFSWTLHLLAVVKALEHYISSWQEKKMALYACSSWSLMCHFSHGFIVNILKMFKHIIDTLIVGNAINKGNINFSTNNNYLTMLI